jgi:hypothetical protein
MSERARAVREGRKTLLAIESTEPLYDPLLDEWLKTVSESKRPRKLEDWVMKMAGTRDLKHRVALQLCRRGILRNDEDKILGIFKRKIYPELDPAPERDIMGRVEEAVFGDRPVVDARTAVLVALTNQSGILKQLIDRKRLKGRQDRIERITDGSMAAEATKGAIEAMHAAIMVATMVPVMVTTAS